MDESRITWCDDSQLEGGYIETISSVLARDKKLLVMVKKVDGVVCDHKGKMNWNPFMCTHCKMSHDEIFPKKIGYDIPGEYFRSGIMYQPPHLTKHPACTCSAKPGEYHYASCEIHKIYPPTTI